MIQLSIPFQGSRLKITPCLNKNEPRPNGRGMIWGKFSTPPKFGVELPGPEGPGFRGLDKIKLWYVIARILQIILPKTWFCWLTRSVSQLQAAIKPRKWSYWTKLTDNIYLGAMPLKNCHHVDKLIKLNIKAILSINEEYEFKTQWLSNPVKPIDWKKRKIAFLKIPSPDLKPVKVAHLAKAVDYVEKQVKLGKRVLIHCNAGRGRSVSAAICALVRTEGLSLKRAIRHVRQLRSHCLVTNNQMNLLAEWYQTERSVV